MAVAVTRQDLHEVIVAQEETIRRLRSERDDLLEMRVRNNYLLLTIEQLRSSLGAQERLVRAANSRADNFEAIALQWRARLEESERDAGIA